MAANSANGPLTRLWTRATASKSKTEAEKPNVSTHGFFATEYVVDMATGEMKRAPLGRLGKAGVALFGAAVALALPALWDDDSVTPISALIAAAIALAGAFDLGGFNTKSERAGRAFWDGAKRRVAQTAKRSGSSSAARARGGNAARSPWARLGAASRLRHTAGRKKAPR